MKIVITESKLKNYIKDKLGVDLTGKIELVQSNYDIPMSFDGYLMPWVTNMYMNEYGPMFLIKIGNYHWLYQTQGKSYFLMDEMGNHIDQSEFMKMIGISKVGLSMQQLIDLYFIEE